MHDQWLSGKEEVNKNLGFPETNENQFSPSGSSPENETRENSRAKVKLSTGRMTNLTVSTKVSKITIGYFNEQGEVDHLKISASFDEEEGLTIIGKQSS